jgi:hypothetical protein
MDWDAVCRRAGGRRHYNAWRQFQQQHRRLEVSALLGRYGIAKHGVQARIARELGVSEATVSRDVRALEIGVRRRQEN